MLNYKRKKGFTLLEVVFVIVILGIVSSVGSNIIAQLYENYIVQNAMHRVSLKTELAINQIANRLTYRINNSVITRRADNTFVPLTDIAFNTTNTDRTVLEWIGYDNESFAAQRTPGWSGYCDTASTSAATGISTPGSNLNFTKTVATNLSWGSMPPLALLFMLNGNLDNNIMPHASCFGYDGNTSCIHQVTVKNNLRFNTNRAANTASITSHYQLARSAFSIVSVNEDALYNPSLRNGAIVNSTTPRSFDLEFRYNYQPWNGTYYNDPSTPRSTIIRNATSFKYAELGGTIRIKLCATERIGDENSTYNVSACKEKVVMR